MIRANQPTMLVWVSLFAMANHLYGRGDFIERGRVFTALAQQREIEACWIALKLPSSPATKIWSIGVWIGDNCYLFEPKLGLPIMDSDTASPVTLAQVQSDERILRRLDIPGRFDYAVNPGDTKQLSFLLDMETGRWHQPHGRVANIADRRQSFAVAVGCPSTDSQTQTIVADAPINICKHHYWLAFMPRTSANA